MLTNEELEMLTDQKIADGESNVSPLNMFNSRNIEDEASIKSKKTYMMNIKTCNETSIEIRDEM